MKEEEVVLTEEEVRSASEDWAHIRRKDMKKCLTHPLWGMRFVTVHLLRRLRDRIRHTEEVNQKKYEQWIREQEKKETYDEVFSYRPKISILVPVYNIEDQYLIPCLESVVNQIYDNWELCISDDCSTMENVAKTLKKYQQDSRLQGKIKVTFRKENGHISRNTNSALELATGEFIAFLDCDDLLRPNALYEAVKTLNRNRELDFIYSDEDKIDEEGVHRMWPHFKSDWAPDTLMSTMYTCHFGVYRRSIALEIGGIRIGMQGSQDYDFTLRFTEKTNRIAHIPKILYHWRMRIGSTAESMQAKPYVHAAARRAKEDAMERRGQKGFVEPIPKQYQYRVVYDTPGNPLVSIIICSRDHPKELQTCLTSLWKKTRYTNYEIIVVDNGSSLKNQEKYRRLLENRGEYLYQEAPFHFSAMCNLGAERANGEYLLFLNDDIKIIEEEWLQRMLGQAMLSYAGAVGAKLLYPNFMKQIQHCGIVMTEEGPKHLCAHQSDEFTYYFGRNRWNYNYLAVTGACLMVSKEKFRQVGGFDESFPVAYNDVELCMRLVEAGYYNSVRNDAVLQHWESLSRGEDLSDREKSRRLEKDRERLYKKHPQFYHRDPFYNPNLKVVTFP